MMSDITWLNATLSGLLKSGRITEYHHNNILDVVDKLRKRVEELEANCEHFRKSNYELESRVLNYRKWVEELEALIAGSRHGLFYLQWRGYRKALEEIKKESGPGYGLDNNCGNCEMVQLIAKKALEGKNEKKPCKICGAQFTSCICDDKLWEKM